MTELNRIRTLAGLSDTDMIVSELEAQKSALAEAHNLAIRQVKAGVRIDEGLFSTLVAALSTAGQATMMGSKAIADKAKKLAGPIKQLYLDAKAKAELKELSDAVGEVAKTFDSMEKDAKTLIARDGDVKTGFAAFKAALQDFGSKLTVRMAATQANESQEQITPDNVATLVEAFMGAYNKQKWVNEHLKDFDVVKHRDLIMHVFAAKLSFSELKALKIEAEAQPTA